MTNYREILRLTNLGLNRSQIADSLGASRTTVIHTLQRAAAQGVDWAGQTAHLVDSDSYTIVIEGKESMRKRKGLSEES